MNESAQPLLPAGPRYKAYPSYKDSGVEWLGEIPAGWEVKRLKHLASLNPESLMEDTDPTFEMVYIDIGGVDSLGRIVKREQLTFASAPSRARRLVRDGDVIVSTVRTYLRAIAPISDPEAGMVVSTGFAVVRPADDLTTDYAAYACRAPYFVERVVANSKGVSFPAINESEMATYELAAPPEPEQRAIAAFLDRETARLDALVAKKERLIELLQEKRTAAITRAVTKGLDPSVPMKDSGVEWLGEIPAHWEVKRLKDATRKIGSGKTPSGGAEVYVSDGVMFLRSQNVHFGALRLDDVAFIDPETDREMAGSRVGEGDVLLNITGASLGRCCVAQLDGRSANVNQHVCVIRAKPNAFEPSFLAAALASHTGQAQIFTTENGISRDALNFDQIGRLVLARPPFKEQLVISALIDRETARIDLLITKVRDAIARLKELRTALISAAVTGKIDVREEVA
ncbi:MAG: restriction endonuclease subunit S [Deltaproteobacteria bacterium]|nr:restriction endonuclease subunit S [Deltaproteobacteria bacterium]